jgi:hypothetical protein
VKQAIGISVHTGWGACVVVGGTLARPQIVANAVIQILTGPERFCFHRAEEMPRDAAERWVAAIRVKALSNARAALTPLVAQNAELCAIVAKNGAAPGLDEILASHPRMHTCEGFFYRDVLREACSIPTHVVPPASLDAAKVGKLAAAPWGRDQKLAALAAWSVIQKANSPPQYSPRERA